MSSSAVILCPMCSPYPFLETRTRPELVNDTLCTRCLNVTALALRGDKPSFAVVNVTPWTKLTRYVQTLYNKVRRRYKRLQVIRTYTSRSKAEQIQQLINECLVDPQINPATGKIWIPFLTVADPNTGKIRTLFRNNNNKKE